MKPTPEQIERAAGALIPFVQEWNLPLNPEDLAEIAYAAPVHHDSDAPLEKIHADVRAQIAEAAREQEGTLEAMRRNFPDTH